MLISPAPIALPISPTSKVLSLAAGRAHLLVLVKDEEKESSPKVFTLGNNVYGQCARPIVNGEVYGGSNKVHCIKHLDGASIKSINCGQDHR
jgi:alpha-tubulin suppressor-like RCC1 family protein